MRLAEGGGFDNTNYPILIVYQPPSMGRRMGRGGVRINIGWVGIQSDSFFGVSHKNAPFFRCAST